MNKISRKLIFTLFAVVLLIGLSSQASALDGVLHGSRNLSVLRTEYFDIIYPEDAKASALKIATVADGYYLDICSRLGLELHIRFPVTITRQVENLNAYFSVYPYNRIVLYDTVIPTDMDMNGETLEKIFYHELTHAITGNIKRGFLKGLSSVFGDWVSPTFFFSTSFWNEGVAVKYESYDEGGRLHDPYSTQMLVQAKLENRFPSWRDVTGARDIYPGGTDAYMFGSVFAQYLCETYGAEQYGAWWKRRGYGKNLVPTDELFESLTRKNMKDTWKSFEQWIPVPPATTSFDGRYGAWDFFVKSGLKPVSKNDFSRLNNKRQLYSCIDTCRNGIVWYEKKTGGIWFCPWDGSEYGKPKKLLSASGVSRLSLSDDGNFVALSYLKAQENTKSRLAILSVKNGSLLVLPDESVVDGGFFRSGKELHLLAVDFSENYVLKDYNLGAQERLTKRGISLSRTITFAPGEVPFSPVDCGNDRFACIVKNGLSWKIRLYDQDLSFRDYGTSKTIIHNLHAATLKNDTIAFSFSYVNMGDVGSMLPRCGLLYVSPWDYVSELVLQTDDISGGVLEASFLPDGIVRGKEKLVYIAGFYDTQRLMYLDFSKRKALHHEGNAPRPYRAKSVKGGESVSFAAAPDFKDASTFSREISYNPFRYLFLGAFFPINSAYPSQRDFSSTNASMIGATYRTANPWGDHFLSLSTGIQVYDRFGTTALTFSGGNDIWTYSLSGNITYNKNGFVQTVDSASLARTLYSQFGKSISLGATGSYLYGRGMQYLTYTDLDGKEKEDLFYDLEKTDSQTASVYALFSTIHKRLPGYFQYGGISFKPFLLAESISYDYINAGATVTLRTPWLFPLTLSGTLFPTQDYFASASISAVLCSFEIQKAIPLLYFKRIFLRSTYAAKIAYEGQEYFDIQNTKEIAQNLTFEDYSDVVQLFLGLHSSINWGFLSYTTIEGGAFLQYRPNPAEGKKKLSFGISGQLVY